MTISCDQSCSPFRNATLAGLRRISSLRSASEPPQHFVRGIVISAAKSTNNSVPELHETLKKIDLELRVLATTPATLYTLALDSS